ncbi:hypothetical protein DFH08DRAFT_869925 [Mycena albidolilacea]|uniref:MYND-type domain-containing protein n=1 Tax=Mycena albidolilacea TaxID=1033008 RepID=A0AAD7ERS0_9AGAR|nr:hypothetical protein DFH08DRAFT_869925 [Mycena albidolilacea]
MTDSPSCSVCGKSGEIFRCSGCKTRFYCGRECQTSDWKSHKRPCAAAPKWYDKHRVCSDGNNHEGRLELITWDCPEAEYGSLGWGACSSDEADDLKKKFETEFGGDEEKFFEYWPQGFRWTCCGTDAGMEYGCDHHGSGSQPCSCDFCGMGKPLPASIFNEKTPSRHGLNLRRGPDPRSFNRFAAIHTATSRTMMGLEM